MANRTNTAARKPAAAKVAPLSISDKLAAATAGLAYPAADNGVAWLALLTAVPAIAAAVAESRAGKYKETGKGLIPGAGDMFSLTALGAPLAATGHGKNGKPNAQAALCMALAAASAALQTDKVCKAAIAFFAVTDKATLATLHGCKATDGNGKATGPRYIGRDSAPCPAWLAGYINGNARADFFKRV